MLARFCVILSLIFAADSTLPNGIRLSDIATSGDRVEIVAGYQAGIRNETGGSSGLASIMSHYFASTEPARAMAVAAYGAGGDIEFIQELDRIAVRVAVPKWAESMVTEPLAAFVADTPDQHPELIDRARAAVLKIAEEDEADYRSKVEDEIRLGLLGSHPYSHPPNGWKSDLEQISNDDVISFFRNHFGTDHAFVVTSSPLSSDLRERLAAVPERRSRSLPEFTIRVINAERTLRFAPDDPTGVVIFASPLPGVSYKAWYSALMLDRLVRRIVPGKPRTSLQLSVDPYYWRLEMPVPAGQFAETVQQELLQDITRMQFSRASAEDLEGARTEAIDYLNSLPVREWFAGLSVEPRRQEGLEWLAGFTADDMRAAARDLLIMNRVIAFWSPKPPQNAVQIRSLNDSGGTVPPTVSTAEPVPLKSVAVPAFPDHPLPPKSFSTPEKLSSGVWLAESGAARVFVSGGEEANSNGSFREYNKATMQDLQQYRADRILVLAPKAALETARSEWSGFKANNLDATVITPLGKVANIDLPALVILKTMLDRKLIESGWWNDVSLRIDATRGAALQIDGSASMRTQVLEWIHAIAAAPAGDADFAWAREAAILHWNSVLPDLQALAWQRVPDYIMPELSTIKASQVQDVAKLYF